MAGKHCKKCLFANVDSIFKVVMKHVKSGAVENEIHGVAGQLDIEHIVPLADSVTVLLQLVWRMFETDPPSTYQEFKNRTSEVTIDLFLNHMHRCLWALGDVRPWECFCVHL